MKTTLLLVLTLISTITIAQNCTPGTNYADSTYGIWPDTTENLPDGYLNIAYSQDLNFKVPSEVSPTMSEEFAGAPINHFTVTNVAGLPPGLDYACNVSNCTYNGGDNGCANIYGNPTEIGVYDITVSVLGNITIEVIGVPVGVDQPMDFDGYTITVHETMGTFEINAPEFLIAPNPVQDQFYIQSNGNQLIEKLTVLNSLGQKVIEQTANKTSSLIIDASNLKSGFYFVYINEQVNNPIKLVKE